MTTRNKKTEMSWNMLAWLLKQHDVGYDLLVEQMPDGDVLIHLGAPFMAIGGVHPFMKYGYAHDDKRVEQ